MKIIIFGDTNNSIVLGDYKMGNAQSEPTDKFRQLVNIEIFQRKLDFDLTIHNIRNINLLKFILSRTYITNILIHRIISLEGLNTIIKAEQETIFLMFLILLRASINRYYKTHTVVENTALNAATGVSRVQNIIKNSKDDDTIVEIAALIALVKYYWGHNSRNGDNEVVYNHFMQAVSGNIDFS